MKIYAINKDGEEISKECDKGFYGEDVYNDREWSPQKPPKQLGKVAELVDKAWVLKDDVRGTWHRKVDGKPVVITALTAEKTKAEQAIDITELVKPAPPAEYKYPSYDKAWKEDTARVAADAEASRVAADEALISAAILAKLRAEAIAELGSELTVVTE